MMRTILKLIDDHDYDDMADWIEEHGGYSVAHIRDRNHHLALIDHIARIGLRWLDDDAAWDADGQEA